MCILVRNRGALHHQEEWKNEKETQAIGREKRNRGTRKEDSETDQLQTGENQWRHADARQSNEVRLHKAAGVDSDCGCQVCGKGCDEPPFEHVNVCFILILNKNSMLYTFAFELSSLFFPVLHKLCALMSFLRSWCRPLPQASSGHLFKIIIPR